MAIFIYPAQSVTASNPSVGLNGDPAPLSSTLVAGTDGTDLIPLSVNSAGALALPQGAATAAKQDTGNTSLANIDGKVATETTLQTLATEATVSTLATEATVSTLATEATVSTLATEATVSTLATEATVSTLATEATVSTLATEATVSTLATAATQTDGSQKTQIVDGSGNVIGSTSNALNVNISGGAVASSLSGLVDTNNSSTTALPISGVFTGTATDIKDYGTVSVLVASDVAAAAGGFSFQFSNNGINWDHAHNFDFAGGNLSYNISTEARYFRLVYTNGAVAQGYFRLQTVLRPVNVMPSQYTVVQPLTDYALGTVTKGVIYGKTTGGGGGYVAVKVNPSGALTVEADVTNSVLPTGAATETTLADIRTSVQLLDNAISGNEMQVDVVSSALPSGAATETKQDTGNTSLSNIDNKIPSNLTVNSTRLLVDGSGVTQPVAQQGRVKANTPTFNAYSSTNVTTAAYVQLVASTTAACTALEIYNQCASSIYLATGAAASETDQLIIPPGGNGLVPITIAAGTRISVKAVDANATSGSLIINYWT